MADVEAELNELFSVPNGELSAAIAGELQSIMRLHSVSPQELMYKWESYSIKMGAETTQMDLKTVRDFKKDLQDILERDSRGKSHAPSANKRLGATPRAGMGGGDVFGMLDGLVPNTPRPVVGQRSASKRKSNFETPAVKSSKQHADSSPSDLRAPYPDGTSTTPTTTSVIADGAGQIQETINAHLEAPDNTPFTFSEARIKIKSNTEMQKFAYKSMAMKLSDASETLDDRIDEFLALIQSHHSIQDSSLGNPTAQSTSEIIAVGRIASDSADGKLNPASLVLETGRRMGAGRRVPLHVDGLSSFDFFPGQIVALKGMNANGDAFRVSEILGIPVLPEAATLPADLDIINARLAASTKAEHDDIPSSSSTHPTNILVASGPYTPSSSLDFAALTALLTRAHDLRADALILLGPFLPLSHPALRSGDFELPDSFPIEPDQATINDVFRYHISQPLQRLVQQHSNISIVLVPSVDDAISKHVSWPQDRLPKKDLGLPRQVSCVTNPITLVLNDVAIGMSSQDILSELRAQNCVGGNAKLERDALSRMAGLVLQQRHFFPVFPPAKRQPLPKEGVEIEGEEEDERLGTGASLDVGYLKLGEFVGVRPDVLILPSILNPFAKVVHGTTVINPGTLSKRRAPGTYARMTVFPRVVADEERAKGQILGNNVYERCRVDIVKIGGSS